MFRKLLIILMISASSANAMASVYFKNNIAPSVMIHGVVYCTEKNEYGTVTNYACDNNLAGGNQINDISYGEITNLSDQIFTPYHSSIKILSVSMTRFTGTISGQQWGDASCDFPIKQIIKNHDYCITFTKESLHRGEEACLLSMGKCT